MVFTEGLTHCPNQSVAGLVSSESSAGLGVQDGAHTG